MSRSRPAALAVWIRAAAFLAALLAMTHGSTVAFGQQCPPTTESWARDCATAAGLDLKLRACHANGFVVDIGLPDGEPLGVDVSLRAEGFRRVGNVSIAPIGEFADWSREPPARQRALDGVTECVRRSPPSIALLPSGFRDRREPDSAVGAVPWFLLALLGCAIGRVLASRRIRETNRARLGELLRDARPGALAAGLSLATLAVRWLVVPRAFFHQNGQGPGWVDIAWRGIQSAYGPGYAEVYHWIVFRSPDAPEGAVFFVNACAGAMIPWLAYLLVRRVSSSQLIAGAVAIALAIAPIAARLSQSESYYLPMTWLLFIATLALADAGLFRVRSREFAADMAIATFAIAQAARIHPVAWVPAAIAPLVMLTTAPSLPMALRRAAVGTGVVGIGVSLLAGQRMWDVVHGSLGHNWIPSAGRAAGAGFLSLLVWVAMGVGLVAFAWKTAAKNRGLAQLGLLIVVICIADRTDLVGGITPAISDAYAALYAAAIIAIVSSGAPRWLGVVLPARFVERACGLAIVAAGLVFAFASARATCTLPTDAREQAWVLGWRRSVPKEAFVYWYGHAGKRMLDLPFYERAAMARAVRLEDGAIVVATRGAYYLHTSLCATDEGRPTCDQFESSHHLVPVEREVLPAIASLPSLPLAMSTVDVVLYRIED